jgi:putative DNA methylase
LRELLIEKWFPVHEASIESGRERAGANMMPPLNYLHLWWARRPQGAARIAAVLAALPSDAYNPEDYRKLLYAMGLRGDPVKAVEGRGDGKRSFGYPVFEGVNPTPASYMIKAKEFWDRLPAGADYMAGGGSIPFEMSRTGYGSVVAGDLNPVAYVIMKAGLEYPGRYGERLALDVERYGKLVLSQLRERVAQYYPKYAGVQPTNYIWVKTFRCPECGYETPAIKQTIIDRVNNVALYPRVENDKVSLHIVKVSDAGNGKLRVTEGPYRGEEFDGRGYVQRGVLECPLHRHTVGGDEVKRQYREAIAAREAEGFHGSHPAILAAAVFKGGEFAEPTPEMVEGYKQAERDLKERWNQYLEEDLIPIELHEKGESDRVVEYGIYNYIRMFNARQLIAHAELVRLIREARVRVADDEKRKGRSPEEAEEYGNAIATYLTLALGKTLDYNSIITSWDIAQGSINHTFDTHAFAWTWDHAEGDMMNDRTGYSWCIKNTLKALKGIVKRKPGLINVTVGDAASPHLVPEGSFDVIITDPPYYGNVQYAEISDYFYVWFKRSLRDAYPNAFNAVEAPKQEEAVANRVRHGGSKLADSSYEAKMTQIFTAMNQALVPDGAFVLWFAHKAGAAWSSTINALLNSGFTITALWGVRAEMERSLHITGKASLKTNILMVCRKREGGGGFLQDALHKLEGTLEPRLEELESYGIAGPDFVMGAQAEALRIASQSWPLRDPEGKLTGQEMLEYVVDQATGLAASYLTRKIAPQIVGVDAPTKFYVLARHLYGDSVPYDDARRLALACTGATGTGDPVIDVAVTTGLGELASVTVSGERDKVLELTPPWTRVRKGSLNPTDKSPIIDWIHQAIATLEEGGSINKAAEHLAHAGGAACDVLKALYEVLPDNVTEEKRTVKNMEKEHVQTLLLTVCQEGLHLQARRRLDQEQAQRRMTEYAEAKPDPKKYDPIIDAFLRGQNTYVKVDTPGTDSQTLHKILAERITTRNLKATVKVTLIGNTVYLEKR